MRIHKRLLATMLVNACAEASPRDRTKIIKEFVHILSEHHLLTQWRSIEQQIHEVWKAEFGVSKLSIISAHELSKDARSQLVTFSRGADIEERVDERLIGGSVVRIDDLRIDGSITGRLRRLKSELSR